MHYLYHSEHFDVYNDFNSVTYIKASSKLIATGQIWVNELANFNFLINYKQGIQNLRSDLEHYEKTGPVEK